MYHLVAKKEGRVAKNADTSSVGNQIPEELISRRVLPHGTKNSKGYISHLRVSLRKDNRRGMLEQEWPKRIRDFDGLTSIKNGAKQSLRETIIPVKSVVSTEVNLMPITSSLTRSFQKKDLISKTASLSVFPVTEKDIVYYHRWAPSLGDFEDTPEHIWGTRPYYFEKHSTERVVFCGLYGLQDFAALQKHKGKKYVWWCGSDIRHFLDGYWIDEHGRNRIPPEVLAPWLEKHCENYVENMAEYKALFRVGIMATIRPSFLGDVDAYPLSYEHSERPKLYTSVSGDDFDLYGWDKIPRLAEENPHIEFHLYGNTKTLTHLFKLPNVIQHGRVPKEQMNEEIKHMQGALRLTEFDGFSEILAKSVLMGQWPVSVIPYLHMLQLQDIKTLHERTLPNTEGRAHYHQWLNDFPWNKNRHA